MMFLFRPGFSHSSLLKFALAGAQKQLSIFAFGTWQHGEHHNEGDDNNQQN
jgi:hypothetical protein